MTDTIQVGAWIDGPHPGKDAASLDRWATSIVKDAGVTRPIIVTNAGVKPIHLSRWQPEHLRDATAALRDAGAEEVGWMIWPIATRKGVGETIADMAKAIGGAGGRYEDPAKIPDFFDIDAEGRANAHGWGPAGAQFADYLCDNLAAVLAHYEGRYLSVTCIPFRHQIRLQDAALLKHAAVRTAELQAYSQYHGPGHWSADPYFRPGPIQRGTWKRWSPLLEEGHLDALIFGMANYNQQHPTGPTGIDAMRFAAQTATDLGVRRFCYWSWKHMRGSSQTHQARRAFLRELAATPCPDLAEVPTQPPDAPQGFSFADALDLLIFGDGEYRAMTRVGCTIRAEDTAADDWQLIRPVGGES